MSEEKYPDLAVAILAGGASRRFGADKALLRLVPHGPALLERTVQIGQALTNRVIVVGHQRYSALELGIPIIPDETPDQGPLAGIATALRNLDRPRVLVLACDLPCLSPAVLRWMIERPSNADVVIPKTADNHWQTMHALYRLALLPTIDALIAQGSRSVRALLDAVVVDEISDSDLRTLDPNLDSFFSLNQPADLARAMRCVALQ